MNTNINTPSQPPQPQLQPQIQPRPGPRSLSISPPSTIAYNHHNHSHLFLPFLPPTTPNSSPSTTTHHKKHLSKLLHMETTTTHEPKPPLKTPKHSLSNHEVTPPCTECGKIFWSKKALFGHMRCHPERPWRGIIPPHERLLPTTTIDDHEVAASLLLLASGPHIVAPPPPLPPPSSLEIAKFECWSCKKTFGSHQALGGHRASHKNVKGCFAITKNTTDVDDGYCMYMHEVQKNEEGVGLGMGLSLGLGLGADHRCGVCFKAFPTGQALGGHMRCHWEKNDEHIQQTQASSSSFGPGLIPVSRPTEAQCGLDLNLPAQLVDDDSCFIHSSKNMQLNLRLGL